MPRDIKKLAVLAKEFNDFINQFDGMVVGRGEVLKLIRYALMTRQHILLYGPAGTAKTLLCDLVYKGITNAQQFGIEMSKFMTEDSIFGAYDMKVMRDEGKLVHIVDGMMPQANLVRIGEILDANPALLRSLLGVLNERRMIRGPQKLQVPLYTAYCDTNVAPGDYLRQNPNGFAVLDRILFMERLDYLDTENDVCEMVARFQGGRLVQPPKTIDLSVIEELSSYIVNPPGLINDPVVSQLYAKIVTQYRKERQDMDEDSKSGFILPFISDRRVANASMLLEAEAVLSGRTTVKIEDIQAAGIVLCTSDAERVLWDRLFEENVQEYHNQNKTLMNDAQMQQLQTIVDELAGGVLDDKIDVEVAAHTLQVLWLQYQSINPGNDVVAARHESLKGEFITARTTVESRLKKVTGLEDIQ